MAHHEKGQVSNLSFFVVHHPSELVTRQTSLPSFVNLRSKFLPWVPACGKRQYSLCLRRDTSFSSPFFVVRHPSELVTRQTCLPSFVNFCPLPSAFADTADCQASATKISRGDFQLRHLRGRSLIISTIASNRACVSLWKS